MASLPLPSTAPSARLPVIADTGSLSVEVLQHVPTEPAEAAFVHALGIWKAEGVVFRRADCDGPPVTVGGEIDVPPTWPGVRSWPAGVTAQLVTALSGPVGDVVTPYISLTLGLPQGTIASRPPPGATLGNFGCPPEIADLLG